MALETPQPRRRGRSLFREGNVVKAMKGARQGGLEIGGVEIAPDGTIRVFSKDSAVQHSGNDLDHWIAKRDAHST
jgi:hypothetical protein